MQPDHEPDNPKQYGADYAFQEMEREILENRCRSEREARIREINMHVPPKMLPCKSCGKLTEIDMFSHVGYCRDCDSWVYDHWWPYVSEEAARAHGVKY